MKVSVIRDEMMTGLSHLHLACQAVGKQPMASQAMWRESRHLTKLAG